MTYYVTTYCNKAHRVSDGKPVSHECHIIPPEALQAEIDDNYQRAIEILEASRPLRSHRGLRRL